MNFLAHLLLSGPDAEIRTGGFLGDFVRGRLDGSYPPRIETGIALHRFVDARTDRHPLVRRAVARFGPDHRRWAPVALDVLFDHFLARDFHRYHPRPLAAFSAEAYAQIARRHRHLNDPAARFFRRMREHDLLGRYADRATVGGALARIAERSRRAAPLATIDGELRALEPTLHEDFARLMPALLAACARWRADRIDSGGW